MIVLSGHSDLVRLAACALLLLVLQPARAQNIHALSPDGRLAAYASKDALWLVETTAQSKPEVVDSVSTYFAVPSWSPTGDRLAYYSAQSGTLQLWAYEVRTGRTRQLSFLDGGIRPNPAGSFDSWANDPLRYSWSPDGKRIAFASDVEVSGESRQASDEETESFPSTESLLSGAPIVLTTSTPPEWTLYGVVSYGTGSSRAFQDLSLSSRDIPEVRPPRSTQIFLLDVESGQTSQLTKDAAGYFEPQWSPDGKRLAYMSVEGRGLAGFGPLESNIYVIELRTERRKKITSGLTQKMNPRWSPDGRWIAYLGQDKTGSYSRREGGVYVIASDGSTAARHLSQRIDRRIYTYDWAYDGASIVMTYQDGLVRPMVRVDVRTGDVVRLSPEGATVDGFASGSQGVIWSQLSGPNEATTLNFAAKGWQVRSITELERAPDLSRERRYEVIRWHNSRDEDIEGIVIYPTHYSKGKTYPLIVDTYSAASIDRSMDHVNYVKASPEYFIFRPNHRAPHMWVNPLRSPMYDSAAVGANGVAVMADDILSGVDTLVRRGMIDAARMCVVGFSNGGLQGLQLLTQTDRFRCAVFQSPATADWHTSFFLATEDPEVIRFMYDKAPWDDPALYASLIPLYHVDTITVPILLAVGDQEPAVITTIEMYNALRYLKRDVTLLRYANQGHGFTGPADADFERRIAAFLATHLGSS